MPFIDADNFGIVTEDPDTEQRDAYNEALGAATRELNSIRGHCVRPARRPGVTRRGGVCSPAWSRTS